MSELREIIAKAYQEGYAAGQVSGGGDHPQVLAELGEKADAWHKAELERVIGEDEHMDTVPTTELPAPFRSRNQLRAEQRKRADQNDLQKRFLDQARKKQEQGL